MPTLAEIYTNNNKAKGTTQSSLRYNYNNSITNNPTEDTNNNGGVLGGIGYALEKVGLGFISGVEGFVDYTVGGLAELFGNDELSEEMFANDWVNYNHADEWYDPSNGWKFVGDIAGGIGTSLPSIAAAAGVTLLSGGVASPLAAKILAAKILAVGVSSTVAGLSAAGNATKEAYQETGMLGGTEFGYGALSGATEAGLEAISGGLMKGGGRIVGEISEWAAKKGIKETTETVAKTVAKKSAKSIFKELGEDFISEAIEEGLSEAVSPLYKRFTYDADAEFATAKEIGYAALVGGLSGLVMSGTRAGVKTSSDYLSGKKVIDNGKADKLLSLAEEVSKVESEYETGFTSFADTKDIYTELKSSLEKTGGEIKTTNQKILLGKLSKATTMSGFMPEIERSAERIASNPEALAAQYSEYLSSASGESINLTAEQLTKGIDMSLATTDRRAFLKQLRAAISTNPALSSLAIADATSHIFMDINKFSDAALNGKHVITQKNLNNFREKASDKKKAALAEKLGIENLDAIDIDRFNAAVESFFNSDEGVEYRKQLEHVRSAQKAAGDKARNLPHIFRSNMADGVYRYAEGGENIALIKDGDSYTIYDYESRNITKPSTIQEVNKALREFWNNKNNSAEMSGQSENSIEKSFAIPDDSRIVQEDGEAFVELNLDSEIQKELSEATEEERGKIVERELKKSAVEGEYTFHDGTVAVMDNKDISKIGHTKYEPKNRTAISLRNLVKVAKLFSEDVEVIHDKFKQFKYYKAKVKVGEKFYECVLNVGLGKFDNRYHIHDINQFNEKNRSGSPILSNPRESGEQTVRRTTTSTDSISQPAEKINTSKKKSSQQSMTDNSASTAPTGDVENTPIISQPTGKIKTSQKKSYTLPEIMKLAKEKVKGYEDMNESKKLMVRGVIREALANGFSESDAVLYARVAARSGVSIKFDKARCATGFVDEDGNVIFADGFYSRASNEIVVNPEGTRSTSKLLIHELTHAIYKTRAGAVILEKGVKSLTDDQRKSIEEKYGAVYQGEAKEYKLKDEKNAHYAEDILGDDKLLEKLLEDKPTLMDKILNFFKGAESDYADDERLSKEARKLYRHYKKLFDKFAERNQDNNLLDDRGEAYVRDSGDESYALNIKYTDGSVEVLADVRGLTNEQAVNYLKQAKSGQIRGHSYIPVRKDTPQVIIDTLNSAGERVDNLSLVMQVRKAQQAMSTKNAGNRSGNNVRSHALRPEDVVEIINKLDEPNTIILQTNRQDKDGNALPNNVAVFVDYSTDGKEGFAVIEFESSIDPEFANDEFGDANYHTVVTLFEPDTERNGEPFDYEEELLSNPNSIDLEIIRRRPPQRSATREKHPNTSKELPSNGSISQNLEKSTQNNEKNFALPDNMDPNNVTVSKNRLAQLRANNQGEKVFYKKDILTALSEVDGISKLTKKKIGIIADRLCQGYNKRVDEQGYEKYSLVMSEKLYNELSEKLGESTDSIDLSSLKEQLEKALKQIVSEARPSAKTKILEQAARESDVKYWKDEYKKLEGRNELLGRLVHQAQKMKELKLGAFANITQLKSEIFKGSIESLSRIEFRGNLNVSGTRKIIADLRSWYTTDNPIMQYIDDASPGYYNKHIAELLEILSQGVDNDKNRDIAERAGGVNTNSSLSPTDNISKNSISQANQDVNNYLNSEKLIENAKKVIEMESVANLSKSEFSADGKTSLKDRVVSFFDGFGNKVTTKEIGTVAVTSSSFRDDKAHGLTYNKVIAFKAIPEVLSEGRVIDVYKPEGKPYTRITIAAPIIIGTEKFYMGVMVQKDNQSNRMYLHDVITEKATTSFTTEPTTHKSEGIRDEGHLFITSILQKALNVNNFANVNISKRENVNKEIKGFTKQDLKMLIDIMSYFTHFVENYNKVWRQGKWVDAMPECERYIKLIEANKGINIGLFGRKFGGNLGHWYSILFGDPMSIARRMDMYESGFFTEMIEDIRLAAEEAAVAEVEVKRDYDAFLKKNKKYLKNATEEMVTYRGVKIDKLHLIGLYMTMKRKHAHAGLAYNGFKFIHKGEKYDVSGFVDLEANLNEAQLEAEVKKQMEIIEKELSDLDKEYISILEKGYNVDLRKLKVDRDMQRLGFTNATDGYYYPIIRADKAINIDVNDVKGEIDRVTNSSFNKDTVKGAKQQLFIEDADVCYNRHAHAVCQYSYFHPVVDAFNHLFNMDTSGNPNKPVSVRAASENVWKDGMDYFHKLISDVQGIPAIASEGAKFFAFIRTGYARYQLGANPKVLATQFSSIFASLSILDYDSIIRGMTLSSADVEEYCSLAMLRNYDNAAAKAQGNLDSKVGDLFMKPIGTVDKLVIGRLFGACQVQVEKNGGPKIGTKENKVKAGELLRKVILETQQNSFATERSQAMRSGSEFWRAVTMFTSDSMKVFGRVVDSTGEVAVLKAKLKAAKTESERTALKTKLKEANKKRRKSTTALTMTAVFMASISQLFRLLYDKEQEEDESVIETMVADTFGNLFGGLPLLKDAYSFMVNGYEMENYTYSAINDLLSSIKGLMEIGDSNQTLAAKIRKVSYALGQIYGIPVRNIYNVLYGLTKRFSPTTAYKIDNVFYEKNYKTDLYKAIEENDTQMVNMLMSMLYNERMGDAMSENVHNELYNLSMKGYKVMPKAVASKITYNGEEIELSAEQQNALRQSYSSSQTSLNKLFSNAKYKVLSDEDKVQAIKYVYELHYDSAFEDVLGIDGGKSVLLNNVFSADILALYYILTKGLESDKDKDGKTISGTKKKKILAAIKSLGLSSEEQMLLLYAKGYSINDSDVGNLSSQMAKKRLLRYILNLKNISKENKAKLAEMCGFEVKNGKIVQKSVA